MRTLTLTSTIVVPLLFAAAVAVSPALPAQSITPCSGLVHGNPPHKIFEPDPNGQGVDLVFTATMKATFAQTLANGSVITTSHEGIEARDSGGRVARKNVSGCFPGADGQQQLQLNMSVTDPKGHSFMSWQTGPGSVSRVLVRNIAFRTAGPSDAASPADTASPSRREGTVYANNIARHSAPPMQNASVKVEALGTQTIAGMTASGIRTTETIPVGRKGNDQPIQIVHEVWSVPDQHLMLKIVDQDPRKGTTTWEVTSFEPGEPDPALFMPPTDYTLQQARGGNGRSNGQIANTPQP